MTFNVRLDIPSDSVNNWNYRKGDACRMIAYYSPDLLGMQEVLHTNGDLNAGCRNTQHSVWGATTARKQANTARYSSGPTDLHWWNTVISPSASNPKLSASRAGTLPTTVSPPWGDTAGKEQRTKVCIFQHPSGQRRKDSPQRGRATHSRQNQGDSTGHARHHHW